MKLSNILQSGFEFTDEEYEQRLQYILFNSLLISNIIFVSLVGTMRFATGNAMQGIVDLAYVLLAGIIVFVSRRSKRYFMPLARLIVFFSMIIVSLTFKLLLGGLVGISWYLILVITAFYLLDKKCAYIIVCLSFFLIIGISYTNVESHYTTVDFVAALVPLVVTIIFIQFYETRNSLSRKRLCVLNAKLDEKVQFTTTELTNSEEKFRYLVENLSDWVWEMDKDGIYAYSSSSIQQILGYEPSEVEGSSHRDFLSKEAIQGNKEFFMDFILKHIPFKDQVLKARHKTGHTVMLEVSGQPIVDSSGIFLGYRGVSRDITRRLSVEKDAIELKEQLQLLRALLGEISSDVSGDKVQEHSILELRGLGLEVWQDIDIAEYVQQERNSWAG